MMLTKKEIILIEAYMADDHVQDYGWDDPDSCTWSNGFAETVEGLPSASVPGVIASLVTKGIMWSSGDAIGLTEFGIEVVSVRID